MADQVTKKTLRQLSINDQVVTNVNVDNVIVDSKLSSGTKIASIQVNGTTTDLFAPEQALAAKVSMSKIVLDEDFEFRGDYVLGKKTDLSTVVHYSKGTDLWSVFKDMFMLENGSGTAPSVVQPSMSLTATTGSFEVGSNVKFEIKAAFDPGSYEYDSSTNVMPTKWMITKHDGTTETVIASGMTLDYIYEVSSMSEGQQALKVEVEHSAGSTPHTSNGSEYAASRIEAGTISQTSTSYGYYGYYYGTLSEPVDASSIDSDVIHSLASGAQQAFPATYVEPAGTKQIIFACKLTDAVKNATRVDLATANGLEDATLERISNAVSVKDANGNAVEYVVFQTTTRSATTGEVNFNKVTIA